MYLVRFTIFQHATSTIFMNCIFCPHRPHNNSKKQHSPAILCLQSHGHRTATHGHARPSHGHRTAAHGHRTAAHGRARPSHGRARPRTAIARPSHGHARPSHGRARPSHGHARPLGFQMCQEAQKSIQTKQKIQKLVKPPRSD